MNAARPEPTRRHFLGLASAATIVAAGQWPRALAGDAAKPAQRKTILSFYCDDTGPYVAGAKAFQTSELRAGGHKDPNPAVWTALLNLARQGRFRSRTVPCFFGSSETAFGIHRQAADGEHAVYDLMPNARDCVGIWENNPARVDPDYYITADGRSGIVVRHVQAAAPYCIWYAHWQGLNPAKGVGWRAFTTVVERIGKHLRDRVVWMRPSAITARYHAAGGWGFGDTK